MNLKYSLGFRLVPKTYLLFQLLILLGFSLAFTPLSAVWLNLLVGWVVAISLELTLSATQKKIVHLPDAAIITATILVGVLAISTPPLIIAFVVAVSILAKHFIRYKSRHLFNPANLGVLLAVFLLGQNTQWWIASNILVIVLLGTFVMSKLRRLWTPFVFLGGYFLLVFLTSPNISLEFMKATLVSDFSIYFFAFIILPEPQTSAWTANGRYINAFLTALIAVSLTLFNIKAPLIIALAAINLLTPIVNEYAKVKRNDNKVDVLQEK